jgi:hypothetical protein
MSFDGKVGTNIPINNVKEAKNDANEGNTI